MQSKIIILLICMLSFAIVHDTILAMMDQKEKSVVTLSTSKNLLVKSHESADPYQSIHKMYHFVALVSSEPTLEEIYIETKPIAYRRPCLPHPYCQCMIKPPIS